MFRPVVLGAVMVTVASAAQGRTINWICTDAGAVGRPRIASIAVTVDLSRGLAKARSLSYGGDVQFQPARVSSVGVAWHDNYSPQTTQWNLDLVSHQLGETLLIPGSRLYHKFYCSPLGN